MGFKYVTPHKCSLCKVQHEVDTPYEEKDFLQRLVRWQEGGLIQQEFPELRPEQREIIISGTCNDAWNELFGEDEEERKQYETDRSPLPRSGIEEDEIPF